MLVELSEGANPGDSTALHNLPHTVLKHVYNSMPGSMFTDFAHTQVSYHNKSPVLNDEIKIRLPLAVTSKHYLLFEVCTLLHLIFLYWPIFLTCMHFSMDIDAPCARQA